MWSSGNGTSGSAPPQNSTFANILKWTTENFRARQSRVYRNTIVKAIGELVDGPDVAGSKARDEIIPVFGRSTLRGRVLVEATS